MSRLALIFRTLPRLGLLNIARVVFYRLRLRVGWRIRVLQTEFPGGEIFDWRLAKFEVDRPDGPATLSLFGWSTVSFAATPDWHTDPFGRASRLNPDQDWVQALVSIGEGDVKPNWELSRFYWLPQYALAACNGDQNAALRAELWLRDWIATNSPYRGINWACGQEAAIRLMNLALSALILDTWRSPSPALKWLIEMHARRILPTLSYAIGQDNNHGSAEACALFIAGTWGVLWDMPNAERIARTGRKWINDRALRLILPDGSPCQYSTTYHRANLEVFCLAGLWSARTGKDGLGVKESERIVQGAFWLHAMTDPATGDAPNVGANDGSHLFNVPVVKYRDFRPTVSMAAALFDGASAWPDYSDRRLAALHIPVGTKVWRAADSRSADNGGFLILRKGRAMALMRYPRFKFRPSQSDLLHVDFWIGGVNLLRDAGTFSYNTDPQSINYFGSVLGHNTVQFDGRDQMPRLSRFLLGDWPETVRLQQLTDDEKNSEFGAGYRDSQGAYHFRSLCLREELLQVFDNVQGPFNKAVLRWRLMPGDWRLEKTSDGVCLTLNSVLNAKLTVSVDVPITGCELVEGWESRHYLEKTPLPVLEVEIQKVGTFKTELVWTA